MHAPIRQPSWRKACNLPAKEAAMIRTLEIPRERWPAFLRMLNRLAGDKPVRFEVARRELGDQEMGNLLPLRDVDLETKGSERGRLVISVGSDRGELTHLIEEPTLMAMGLNELNEPQWLAIRERSDATTILHFEQLPALPAMPAIEDEHTLAP
jgi:hypothetical protein